MAKGGIEREGSQQETAQARVAPAEMVMHHLYIDGYTPPRITEPTQSPPTGDQTAFQHEVDAARNRPEDSPDGKIEYPVRKDDSLIAIARAYGLTLEELAVANPKFFAPDRDPNIIHPGETVIILDEVRQASAEMMAGAVDEAQAAEQDNEQLREQLGDEAFFSLRNGNPEIEDRERDAWGEVRHIAIVEMYYAAADSPTPTDELDGIVEDILARFPGNEGVERQVNAARREVEQVWEMTGRTPEVQGELIRLTEAVEAARESGQAVEPAEAELVQAIEDILAAANRPDAAIDPMLRLAAIEAQAEAADPGTPVDQAVTAALMQDALMPPAERSVRAQALTLLVYGPDDPAFHAAVAEAQDNVLVRGPAQAVAEAYEQGGAPAAMTELREVTAREVATPDTAAAILREAMPTVEQAIEDLVAQAGERAEPWPNADPDSLPTYTPTVDIPPNEAYVADNLPGVSSVDHTVADLVAAVEQAADGDGGNELVRDIADALVEEGPSSLEEWDLSRLDVALSRAIAGGEGATLQLEIVRQLEQSGRQEEAEHLLVTVSVGAEVLTEGAQSTVDDFIGTEEQEGSAQEFMTLITDWDELLSEAELDRAIRAYSDNNPETVQRMENDLARIHRAGYALDRFARAWETYGPDLQGLDAHGEIDGTVGAQWEETPQIGFARTFSPSVQSEALIAEAEELLGELDGVFAQPARVVRSGIKSLTSGALLAITHNASIKRNTPPGVGVNAAGAGLSGTASFLVLSQDSKSFLDWAYGLYFAASVAQEVPEAATGLMALRGWADQRGNWWSRQVHAIGTEQHAGWRRFSKGLGAIGVALDLVAAAQYASEGGQSWQTFFSLTSAGGGVLILAGSTGIGTVVVAVSLAGIFFANVKRGIDQANRYEGPTEQFLIDAGLRPEIAKQLSNHDGKGVGAAARLEPLAEELGLEPRELLQWLNEQDVDFVEDFVKNALHPVEPDEEGDFRRSDPDGNLFVSVRLGRQHHRVRVIGVTDDGQLVTVNRAGNERTRSLDEVRIREPTSLEGIELWAELQGTPLPTVAG